MCKDIQQLAEVADAGGGQRPYRPRRDAINPYSFRTQALREVTHVCLQACLGNAHDIVIGNGLHGAEVT
jgi:hypothetical protein